MIRLRPRDLAAAGVERLSRTVGVRDGLPVLEDGRWLEEVLAIISLKDQVERVKKQRQETQERVRRMAQAYVDGLFRREGSCSWPCWMRCTWTRRNVRPSLP